MFGNIKKYILFTLILLLTGCSVEYNLNIDENLIVEENVSIKELNTEIRNSAIDVQLFVDDFIYAYANSEKYGHLFISKDIGNNNTKVDSNYKYLSLEDYKDRNVVLENVFYEVNISSISDVHTLEFKVKENIDILKYSEEGIIYEQPFEDIKINVKLPFKVIESNADFVDKDVYTWNYSQYDSKKDLKLTFNSRQSYIEPVSKNVYIGIGILLFALSTSGLIYYKYKKNSIL